MADGKKAATMDPKLDIVVRLRRQADKICLLDGSREAIALHRDAADEIERLRDSLGHISRMKLSPDDKVNSMTLLAASQIARGGI